MTAAPEPYDIVILGGGITGAGIARDAALRGLRVALFEKGDYASGTSSKSSKLIHGGLRYLEHGEFGLVFESVSERAVQRHIAPHLVRSLPFLLPVYEDAKPGLGLMNIGLWIYDTMALFRAPKLHRTFRGERAAKLEPALFDEGLKGAIEYYDCVTDDARLVLENVLDAIAVGADCHSHTEVLEVVYRDHRVEAVRVRDRLSGDERTVPTRSVVIAAGAWTDEVARDFGLAGERNLLRRTKGVHIVFPRSKLPLRRAVTIVSQKDGRVMFAIPWKSRTVLGTTDTDFQGTADEVYADAADVRYLCEGANRYFPRVQFTPDEVIATWAGLRPLINDEADTPGAVSREHHIFVRDEGVIVIAGGKLTTYRRMAKECVKKTLGWLRSNRAEAFEGRRLKKPGTKRRPLPGAAGLRRQSMTGVSSFARSLVTDYGLERVTAHHLSVVYGSRARAMAERIQRDPRLGQRMQDDPDMRYVWAEVVFAVENDLARTIDDVLARRIPLLLVGRDQGLDVVEMVADEMAMRLNWSPGERDRQIREYREVVARSRRFRQ